ncbi:MAG: ATP phosphoribosyltransferase [Myxococcales bacterium]|nr:ATP phosphoribosyltransferase [Myxococcales bacterium]
MLELLLPKGRIFSRVETLLSDCGLHLSRPDRVYRPVVSDSRFRAKIMKAQNIPALIELGSHDVGFTGYDWVQETGADVVELLDLGFDPVQIVAAAPEGQDVEALLATPGVRVATEYEALTRRWLDAKGANYHLIRSWGATEVFAPEDADLIVDNTATGTTLRENGLEIVDTLLRSTTRLYAHKGAMDHPEKRQVIDELLLLMHAVIDARKRVLLEMNIDAAGLEKVIAMLPAMKSPTVARLYNSDDYAVKVAVPRPDVARLVPELKRLGATDILEMDIRKVIP